MFKKFSIRSTGASERTPAERFISDLKVIDYLVLRVIEVCFWFYRKRIENFIARASASERRALWEAVVESHLLFKSKSIMGFLEAKQLIENVNLHEVAQEIANPPADGEEVVVKLPPNL